MDIIYRVWRFFMDGSKPVDWLLFWVDILVLGAILWFELPEWKHRRKAAKFARALLPYMERGREIQASIPENPHGENKDVTAWIEQAKLWHHETHAFISGVSPRAALVFTSVSDLSADNRKIVDQFGGIWHISGFFGDVYQILQARLDNLQKILERPEVYL